MTPHTRTCDRAIATASAASALVAAVLSPVPLADELALVPLYAGVVARLARAHGVRLGDVPWRAFAAATWGGLLARAGVNLVVAFVPLAAAVANATTASALTAVLARHFDEALAEPGLRPATLDLQAVRDRLRSTRRLWRAA